VARALRQLSVLQDGPSEPRPQTRTGHVPAEAGPARQQVPAHFKGAPEVLPLRRQV